MKTITVCSTKGGAGKTTLSANLGGMLSDQGYKVLLIDADIQPTLSSYFTIKKASDKGLTHLIQDAFIDEHYISRTTINNLDIVYSNDPSGSLQTWIPTTADGRTRLLKALKTSSLDYDYVLIDTQGAVGALQDAAIMAADLLVSPVPPEILSAKEFIRGTIRVINSVSGLEFLGIKIAPLKTVIYRADRTNDSKTVKQVLVHEINKLRNEYKREIDLFKTIIPARVAFREAATRRLPVHLSESPASLATQSMFELCAEIIECTQEKGA